MAASVGEPTEMSFAGIILACWLLIAVFAFLALSAIGRTTADRQDDAELGIVGAAELRMLLGHGEDDFVPLEARLANLGLPSGRHRASAARRAPGVAGHHLSAAALPEAAYMVNSADARLGGAWDGSSSSYRSYTT
jgi:hypothetical protein